MRNFPTRQHEGSSRYYGTGTGNVDLPEPGRINEQVPFDLSRGLSDAFIDEPAWY